MAEFEIVEDDEEVPVAIPQDKKERVSDPFKQALAGVTDIGTGLPMLAGLAGAGIEGGWNTLTGEGGFKKNFEAALKTGFDRTLFDAGIGAREFVNETLGIKDPVSTEDQAARLAASFLPIPGFAMLGGASKLGRVTSKSGVVTMALQRKKSLADKLLNAARTTSNVLLPTVKRTGSGKGFAARGAAQLGLGLGVDQGIRALVDDPKHPLIFSEAALAGQAVPKFSVQDDDEAPLQVSTDILDGNGDGLEKLIDLDRRTQKKQEREDLKFWIMIGAAALIGGAAAKWARSGRTDTIKEHASEIKNRLTSKHVDKSGHIDDSLAEVGTTEASRNRVVSNSHTDPIDIAVNFNLTGELGQGFIIPAGKRTHAANVLEADEIALGDRAAQFREAMEAQSVRASQIHGAGNLFPNARPASELDEVIRAARADPEVKALMDKMSENFDVLLDYQVHRGTLTQRVANNMRAKARLPDTPGGRLAYMPLYARDRTTMLRRLSNRFLGTETKEGRNLAVIAEHGARSINTGTDNLSPIAAMRRYALATITDANTQSYRAGVLDAWARISRVGNTVTRELDAGGVVFKPTARDARYIGKGTDLSDIDNIPIKIFEGDTTLTKFKSGSLNDLRAKHGNSIETVHIDGELRVYHVPDQGQRAALNLNPKFNRLLKTLNSWNKLMTAGTTGKASLFAPISGAYSAQQIAINTAGQYVSASGKTAPLGAIFSGAKSVGDSLKGVAKLGMESAVGDVSRFFTNRLARHIAKGTVPPKVFGRSMEGLQKALHRRFIDSMMNNIRKETGRTQTGIGNIGHGTIEDIMNAVGRESKDFFGADQMGLLRALWSSWNNAWHEGPAYGAMLRHIDKSTKAGTSISPQVMRDAVDISKTLAGDMRRVGSSGFAQGFHAAVPFSAAMVQSWSSIGGAFLKNKTQFMAGASALIGVPTMSELAYNAILSEASGTFILPNDPSKKEWTYNDYYWNGFTTQQRTDNFIYFVPGRPPWEAILVPVSPEWGLFRGAVMEAADAVFNLSDVGDIGLVDQAKTNRSMFLGAAARVLDIPMPPLLGAAASGLGMDIRFGLAAEESTDPDDPGLGPSFIRTRNIGGGERITRRSGKTRYVQGDIDRKYAAMLEDIFGAAGTLYIGVHNAVASGLRGREGSLTEAASQGLDALGQGLKKQARYTQPLLGKAMRPNTSDEIAQRLFVTRKNLKDLNTQFRNGYLGGGLVFSEGALVTGHIPIPDDPLTLEIAASASAIEGNIAQLDKQISILKKDITTIPHAIKLGPISKRNDLVDAKILEIQTIKAQQLAAIHDIESKLSDYFTNRYGRDIEIDLSSHKPRPDTTEGPTLRSLLTPPQTSQSP
jgi:hypothetical protein